MPFILLLVGTALGSAWCTVWVYLHHYADYSAWWVVLVCVLEIPIYSMLFIWFLMCSAKTDSTDSRFNTCPFWIRHFHLKVMEYRIRVHQRTSNVFLERRILWGFWHSVHSWTYDRDKVDTYVNHAKQKLEEKVKDDWEYAYGQESEIVLQVTAKNFFSVKD